MTMVQESVEDRKDSKSMDSARRKDSTRRSHRERDEDRDHDRHREKDRDRSRDERRSRDHDEDHKRRSRDYDKGKEREDEGKKLNPVTPEFLHALANSPTKTEFDVISGADAVRFTRKFVRYVFCRQHSFRDIILTSCIESRDQGAHSTLPPGLAAAAGAPAYTPSAVSHTSLTNNDPKAIETKLKRSMQPVVFAFPRSAAGDAGRRVVDFYMSWRGKTVCSLSLFLLLLFCGIHAIIFFFGPTFVIFGGLLVPPPPPTSFFLHRNLRFPFPFIPARRPLPSIHRIVRWTTDAVTPQGVFLHRTYHLVSHTRWARSDSDVPLVQVCVAQH
ncbi:hypothetical protein B0H12DRAFT_136376 [Mycena haematopus]|nr:hypothetical protein B0H12DRAFT_136376 [Mycena haematopus]